MTFAQRAKKIRWLVLDVDGVLTDGKIVYDDRGRELKFFDVQDGAGLVYWKRAGRHFVLLTARTSRLVAQRGRELGADRVYQGAMRDKLDAYLDLKRRFKLTDDMLCVVGDDLMELPLFRRAGLAVAVANAVPEVQRVAHYVTRAAGGEGAVREIVERLLKAQRLWPKILARYLA